jgi:hypothetical protein
LVISLSFDSELQRRAAGSWHGQFREDTLAREAVAVGAAGVLLDG